MSINSYIAQYYAEAREDKDKILALAELLGCEYRIVEEIITLQVKDETTLSRLKRTELQPYSSIPYNIVV